MSSRNSVATWADSVVRVDGEWKGSLPWLGWLKRPDEVGCAHEKAPPGFAESGEDLQQYVGDPLECRWRPTNTLCLLHAAEALVQVAREHSPASPIPEAARKRGEPARRHPLLQRLAHRGALVEPPDPSRTWRALPIVRAPGRSLMRRSLPRDAGSRRDRRSESRECAKRMAMRLGNSHVSFTRLIGGIPLNQFNHGLSILQPGLGTWPLKRDDARVGPSGRTS